MNKIGYDKFIELCCVDDPQDWHGMVVRKDGVWVEPPPDDVLLFPKERAALSEHPDNDLKLPALAFPCSVKKLRNFLDWIGAGVAETYLGAEKDTCLSIEGVKPLRKGGRPQGPLRQVLEYCYLKFQKEGNKEILRTGKIREFLIRIKELADENNKVKCDEFVAERIESVKIGPSGCVIKTKKHYKEASDAIIIIIKAKIYNQGKVSKRLNDIRKKYPLQS